jgi:hypothetical protein
MVLGSSINFPADTESDGYLHFELVIQAVPARDLLGQQVLTTRCRRPNGAPTVRNH